MRERRGKREQVMVGRVGLGDPHPYGDPGGPVSRGRPRRAVTRTHMHPAYFEVRFRSPKRWRSWPDAFAIVTAYATTGEAWSDSRNREADRRLEEVLRAWSEGGQEGWAPRRVTGFSPATGHAEPGWAVPMSFEEACELGLRFCQDALFWVEDDALYVSYCDHRRALVSVGSFRDRLEGEPAR